METLLHLNDPQTNFTAAIPSHVGSDCKLRRIRIRNQLKAFRAVSGAPSSATKPHDGRIVLLIDEIRGPASEERKNAT